MSNQFAEQLNTAIHRAYVEFFNSNFLEKHFHSTGVLAEINTYRINNNMASREIQKETSVTDESSCGRNLLVSLMVTCNRSK
jgi:hypothetical protein